jgi:xanthine dehydrogenase YagS FAD-binding subunit
LRNQGTIGGNLCQRPRCWYFRGEFDCAKKGGDMCYAVDGENRYHAILGGGPCYIVHPSDPAPMLSALGAELVLEGPDGRRRMLVEDFYQLPVDNLEGETVLEPGEIVTEVRIAAPGPGARSLYRKVRERRAWDFALASVALALDFDGATVRGGRVAFGGVAPVPWRSIEAEAEILGKEMTPEVAAAAARAAVADADPLEQNGFKVSLLQRLLESELLRLARG